MQPSLQSQPRISLAERDRRWARVREQLRERGADCVIVQRSNLFYLSNGIPSETCGLLPTEDLPMTVCVRPRTLSDLPASVLEDAQDWVKDVRAGDDPSGLIGRVRSLGLDEGTIAVAGLSGLSQGVAEAFHRELPEANLIDVGDVFLNLRTIKTDEEIAMIERANEIFDAAVARVHQVARVGMLGREVVQAGIQAMWEAGGDLESVFSFNFGATPKQNPALATYCLDHRIEPGDIGTLTAHAEYGRYSGHTDQEIVFGEPSPLHKGMFEAVVYVRGEILKVTKPGSTYEDLMRVYRRACDETGFRTSPHTQTHQYGIDVPEYPGPGFDIPFETQRAAGRVENKNYPLQKGMIFSISPTLMALDSDDTLLGGTSLVVTETGCRDLSSRQVELLIAHD